MSRLFAPVVGVNEDPVAGSAHNCLASYWSNRLGKDTLTACQASVRGGVLRVRLVGGNRVKIAGKAVTVWKGSLVI